MYKIEKIKNVFESRTPQSINKLKHVSVMIALIDINGELNIIFQKRSKKVMQPSDISLIGGHVEKDEEPLDSLIREAKEECYLEEKNINVIGESDYLINFNDLYVHSYACEIVGINFKDIKYNEEVEKLIAIPITKIANTKYIVYTSDLELKRNEDYPYHLIENGKDYKFFLGKEDTYFYEFDECVIWGLTAKIIHNFVESLK